MRQAETEKDKEVRLAKIRENLTQKRATKIHRKMDQNAAKVRSNIDLFH